MNRKALFQVLIVLVLLSLISSTALAGSTQQQSVVQGVTVYAQKGLSVGPAQFTAYVWSFAQSNIGTIGWTWWTVREYCPYDGSYPVNAQFGGDANYNDDSDYGASNHYNFPCPGGQKQIQNLGTHDFKNGTNIWRPLVNYVEYY